MKVKSFAWMSNPQYLAQVGHFFGAYFVVSIGAFLTLLLPWPSWAFYAWYGVGVAAASFKEFVFDTASWGEGDSWSDSLMDWSFYMLGGGVGLGAYYIQAYLLGRLLHC